MFSHESSEWVTPQTLFDELNKEFKFYLDPCTTKDNPLGTEKFFTKENNGLDRKWYGNVFVNPPYNDQIGKWLAKALNELENSLVPYVVFLLPARTDTKWFHKYIYSDLLHDWREYVDEVRFIKGRLKFRGSKNSAPFPSMIVIFKNLN